MNPNNVTLITLIRFVDRFAPHMPKLIFVIAYKYVA